MRVKSFTDFVNEQATGSTLLTILATPRNVGVLGKNNTNLIFLAERDPKSASRVIGDKHLYKVTGKYGPATFEVTLRNVYRGVKQGALHADAKPNNSFVAWTMEKLVPKESVTPDGWLKVLVSNDKINDAIQKLKNNQGSKAVIDAGQGVTIVLTKAGGETASVEPDQPTVASTTA